MLTSIRRFVPRRLLSRTVTRIRDDFSRELSDVDGTLRGKLGELNKELGNVKKDIRSLMEEVRTDPTDKQSNHIR